MGKLLWMRGVYGKAGSIDYDQKLAKYKMYSGGGILIDQGILHARFDTLSVWGKF